MSLSLTPNISVKISVSTCGSTSNFQRRICPRFRILEFELAQCYSHSAGLHILNLVALLRGYLGKLFDFTLVSVNSLGVCLLLFYSLLRVRISNPCTLLADLICLIDTPRPTGVSSLLLVLSCRLSHCFILFGLLCFRISKEAPQ